MNGKTFFFSFIYPQIAPGDNRESTYPVVNGQKFSVASLFYKYEAESQKNGSTCYSLQASEPHFWLWGEHIVTLTILSTC